jgi:hypothetical protein
MVARTCAETTRICITLLLSLGLIFASAQASQPNMPPRSPWLADSSNAMAHNDPA